MIRLNSLFPFLALLASAIAYWQPQIFVGLKSLIIPLLAFIMFCMGLTLTLDDFKRVSQHKKVITIGLILQYSMMPALAYAISLALGLPDELLIGMVLVGSASGGTASNVICYLAKADVAMSISLTLCSTLLATVALPALTWIYVGEVVPVPALSMLVSVAKIVLIPVMLGIIINHFLAARIQGLKPLLPALTVSAIILVIAVIVALNHANFAGITHALLFAVVLHNLLGLLAGYWGARLFTNDKTTARTIAIEVGMQNSGLAVALASKYFSAVSALPGALFSIWHNLSGSVLAAYWGKQADKPAVR